MKRIITILTFASIYAGQLFAQDCKTKGLEKPLVKKFINQQFGNLINPQSNNNIGNFASLDLKEAEVNFGGNIIFKNGSILGIKAKGAVTDGFLPVFSNDKLNTKLGLDIQYNFLDFKKKSIIYDNSTCEKYLTLKKKVENDYEIKKIEIENGQKKILLQIEIENLNKQVASLENNLEIKKIEIEKEQNKLLLQIEIEKIAKQIALMEAKLPSLIGLSKDSLNIEILKTKQAISFKKNQLDNQAQTNNSIGLPKDSLMIEILKTKKELAYKNDQLTNLPSKEALLFELDNWKASEIIKAQTEVKIYGFKIGWFSLGYGITNNAFKLFDGTLTPDKQISKYNYANHSLRLQYNFYNRTPASYESYFISVGTALSLQDNFSDLTKVEINETKNYGTNPNDRFITTKYNAYQGTYSKDLKSLSLYADFYWFLFDDNKGAFHFYPEQKIVENLKPSTNLGFGFLMTFKNKEKTENIINSELYVNLLDVSDNKNSTEKLFTRSSYGIRFTFPINFNSKL